MDKSDKRWRTLNDLLAQALQQPVDTRDRWIEQHCVDDPSLGDELRELLRYDLEESGGLASAIAEASARADILAAWGAALAKNPRED